MGIEFARSAGKHGISEQDALYAVQHAVYSSDRVKVNNAGRPGGSRRVFVGPQHAQTERLIEVVPGGFVVYHVMPLGSYYRAQMEGER
ncbi:MULTISPECIES: hypothetical protein [unclassified Leifsonia]|uniref:hypothetical protein n=1 Tax=unclassified Leifsonia TaxID=2663824 RepID=UPI0008F2902F|nr:MULTISPECIES: hypothetical protein [unclassified Leifsonia]SFL21652.1 hypothetical protein SAMN04515692_101317 [Leifsonia sp. CL147]